MMKHSNAAKNPKGFTTRNLISVAALLFLLAGCSVHGSGNKSPAKLGLPNQTIDAVTAGIREENRGDDAMAGPTQQQQKFQVFMTDLPDETGKRTDAGLVTLSGGSS